MLIQVIGATGMLGSEVSRILRERGHEVYDSFVDIACIVPTDIRGQIVINCSGVSPSTASRDRMLAINQSGPHQLATACDEAGIRMVHVSTDAVFNHPGPHAENDTPDPSSLYGRSKLKGEVWRQPHLTVRTSFIGFGKRGILTQLLTTDEVISASARFRWSGHTAAAVAAMLVDLALRTEITGLIHTPGSFQTRYDLVGCIIEKFGLSPKRLTRDDSYVTDRRLVSNRWKRNGLAFPAPFYEQMEDLRREYDTIRQTRGPNIGGGADRTEAAPPNMVAGDGGEHLQPERPA